MEIVNPDADLHTHSLQFSDGLNTIDELVQMAGRLGLKKLAITDHSDARTYPLVAFRVLIDRYQNVLNDVEVILGVEGDLLNDEGDICTTIQKQDSEFAILSAHRDNFKGDHKNVTAAYIKAMERHHRKIQFIGHPCDGFKDVNIEELTVAANKYAIPLELNVANLVYKRSDLEKVDTMLSIADQIVVNSDAHSLADMAARAKGFDYLRGKGLLT